MYDVTTSTLHHADPTVRSSIYQLLSLAFRYPTPEVFEAYKDGDFISELWAGVSHLPHLQPLVKEEGELKHKVKRDLEGVNFRDFEVGYTRTFDVGAPEPPCPPYEGVHREGIERTHIMLEVSEFYKHFGLKMNNEEGKRELPDNLCAELEFLHFLTFKEAQAMQEETPELLKGYVLAQKDFLERHIMTWFPRYSEKLEKSAKAPFYSDLARITQRFTNLDLEWATSRLRELEQP
jgi:DMSO reductase family type II enzyme chaperone